MKDFNRIGEDLFNKLRGRFQEMTIGDEDGNIINEPAAARFFDFEYSESGKKLGKVSVSISEDDGLTVIYSRDFIQTEDEMTQKNWYNFLRELRKFSKKRLLNFDIRDINKSNLTKRDYKFLATNRPEDLTMNESKLYGTGRVSYQNVDGARMVIKHTENIDQTVPSARTRKIGSIYIESADGERFKYPYRHLSGARAMSRHVAEGGNPYDDFGSYILGLSEEMSKLRKFKTYMNRSAVMAESLAEYIDIVKERISTVKKTIENLQKPNYYKEAVNGFEKPMFEEVPEDVAENWIDELTIRQFNEELKDVFPYIYNLVKEGTRAKALGPEDLLGEDAELVEFNIRTNKKFTFDGEYKNYDIYVNKQKDTRGYYMSYALRGNKEMQTLRGQGPNPQTALKMTKQKIDDTETKAEKISSNATINLNVNFIREELPYSTRTEAGDVFYAKLDKGPSLVIANEKWGDDAKELDFQKVSYKKLRSAEGTFSGGVFGMPASVISSLDLVRHGRYILGSPKTDEDENYVFPMTFHSVAAASNDPLKLGKPAVGINPARGQQESFEEDLLGESDNDCDETCPKSCPDCGGTGDPEKYKEQQNEGERHGNSKVYDKCWKGYRKVPGKKRGEKGSCKKVGEEQIEEYFDSLMGQFNENDKDSGTLYVKFRQKKSLKKTEKGKPVLYPVAFAGFVSEPDELKYNGSLRQYNNLGSLDQVQQAAVDLMTDKVFVKADKIVLLYKESMLNKYSQIRKFFELVAAGKAGKKFVIQNEDDEDEDNNSLIDPNVDSVMVRVAGQPEDKKIGVGAIKLLQDKPLDKGSQVQITSGEFNNEKGIVTKVILRTKKRKKYHYGNISTTTDKKAPTAKMTRYFKIDNGKLFHHLRQNLPDLMQKYFKPNFGGFVMNDNAFKKFEKFVNSPNTIEKFGVTTIDVDDEKSFAEDKVEDKAQTPLSEFILSYFDYTTGQFPKGETAILTMVEKDYGEEFIEPAKAFIERINERVAEVMGFRQEPEIQELDDITRLAGL